MVFKIENKERYKRNKHFKAKHIERNEKIYVDYNPNNRIILDTRKKKEKEKIERKIERKGRKKN